MFGGCDGTLLHLRGLTLGWHGITELTPVRLVLVTIQKNTEEKPEREKWETKRHGERWREGERERALGVRVHSPTPGAVTELAGLF